MNRAGADRFAANVLPVVRDIERAGAITGTIIARATDVW